MLGVLLALMLIGIPILLCIALVGFIGIAAEPGIVLPLFAQKTFAQLDSYTLLALPFFILAGSLMSAGGMSQQLVDFSRVLVGHFRAGLAHASVVASMVFAGISGSSTADASAIWSRSSSRRRSPPPWCRRSSRCRARWAGSSPICSSTTWRSPG